MATFSGDVQYSQNGTVTNPCLRCVFWENYDGPVPKNPVDLVSEEQTVGDG